MLGDLNERAISLEEVMEAVNEMKSGKAPGLDGFPVECLMKGSKAVLECIVRNLVPLDSRLACIVPLYKGKGTNVKKSSGQN